MDKGIKKYKKLKLEGDCCFLCGSERNLERHHVYGGPNRDISEKCGFVVTLCDSCHRNGKAAVHSDYEKRLKLKKYVQSEFEKENTRADFMKLIGRNYLD